MPNRDVYACHDVKCNKNEHLQEIDSWCIDLVDYCLQADSVLPSKQGGKKTIPGWNTHIKPFKDNNKFWYDIWKSCGRPRNGYLFEYMKEAARRNYMYAIRRVKRKESEMRNVRLTEALLQSDSRDFFTEIKRINAHPKSSHGINGSTDAQDIANTFCEKYKSLYNCVPSDKEQFKLIEDYIGHGVDNSSYIDCFVSYSSVKLAVKKLKHEKSDGDKGFISSHLIHASDSYHRHLANLLSSMIIHGYHPKPMVTATIISIPKDYRADLTNDDNYRGIALSSSLSKLFDLILLERNCEHLATSPLQFAYKQKMSTSMCTLVMKEVIKHYLDNKSNVYSCCIDASKAFDRLRHDKLFTLLMERCMPALDLRILLQQYRSQQIRTKWQNKTSDYFEASNGIRQGSIASPILFCVYLDKLLIDLKKAGIGCWMGNKYFGTLAYADDLTLLSPSASGLQSMIDICQSYVMEYGMQYNVKKTVCTLFTRNRKVKKPQIMLSGSALKWTDCVKHLGNYVASDLKETDEILKKKSDLVGRANLIIGSLGGVNVQSKLKVMQTQCSFYGAWRDALCAKDVHPTREALEFCAGLGVLRL